MSVSPSFRTFVLEQLGRGIQGIRGKSMFGGVGIYAGEYFFALIDDDVLYFKVDDSNRPDYDALGLGPFRPGGPSGEVMQYYRAPEDILDDADQLTVWAEKAIAVARQAKAKRTRRAS